MSRKILSLLLLVAFSSLPMFAQVAEPEFVREAIGAKSTPAAPRLAQTANLEPAITLSAAALSVPEELEAIRVWNDAGRTPARNGFTRRMPEALTVTLGPAASMKEGAAPHARGLLAASSRGVVWSGVVQVSGAYRLRLRLDQVKLPEGAVLWVYGQNDEPVAFGAELLDEQRGLWTPSVAGELAYLEIEAPLPKSDAEAASFRLGEVLEIVPFASSARSPRPGNMDDPSCLIDVTCVSPSELGVLSQYSKAVAHLQYVKDGGGYVCSGGLINDKVEGTSVPYFLTANHCFATQSSASSLEAFWDWRFADCSSTTIPNEANFPRSNGATLLSTNASTDYTFLRMNSIPSGRIFLGWNSTTNAVGHGTKLFRISHPAPDQYGPLPQMFSTTFVNTNFGECPARPSSRYVYSTGGEGGVYGGSSGSPVIIDGGYIVGQLFGSCGPDPEAGCDQRNATVDGAFHATFASVKQWLDPTAAQPEPCVENANTVCLSGNRFAVSVRYTAHDGRTGQATAIKYTPASGLFWFFDNTNIEMIIKTLNGCGVNNRWWVYGAATTDVAYTITVRDTQAGTQKTYTNALGNKAPAITDSGAFVCP